MRLTQSEIQKSRALTLTSARPHSFSHPRNKTDARFPEIVEKGGFVGIAAYAPFMHRGGDSTLNDMLNIFEHVINICGEVDVGIGTDLTEDTTRNSSTGSDVIRVVASV